MTQMSRSSTRFGFSDACSRRISIALDLGIEAVSSALFVATIVIALIQVFFRYVLNNSLSWPDELSRFALTWMIFLGTAMVTRRARQISIDLTTRSLGPRSLSIHAFAVRIIMAAVAAFLLHYGSELVAKASHITPPAVADCVPLSCGAGRSRIVTDILVLEPVRGTRIAWSGILATLLGVGLVVMLSAPGLTMIGAMGVVWPLVIISIVFMLLACRSWTR
jgi:TRAP-type C4-dicarboxylate transport system permease small subunit